MADTDNINVEDLMKMLAESDVSVAEANPYAKKTPIEKADSAVAEKLKGIGRGLKKGAMKIPDYANVALDSAMMGGLDDFVGAAMTPFNLMTPEAMSSPNPLKTAFNKGHGAMDTATAIARDRLSGPEEFAADIAGYSRFGPAGMLMRLMDKGGYAQDAIGFLGASSRVGLESGKGGADQMIRGIMEGDRGTQQHLVNFMMGAGGGAAGQALFGEVAPFLIKYGLARMSGADTIGKALFNTGPTHEGLNVESVRKNISDMKHRDETLLQSLRAGEADTDVADIANRLADLTAKARFTSRNNITNRPEDFEDFAASLSFMKEALKDANDEVTTASNKYLREHNSTYDKYKQSKANATSAVDTYKSLNNSADPDAMGALDIGYDSATDTMGASLAKLDNVSDISEVSSAHKQAWDLALGIMGGLIQGPNSKKLKKSISASRDQVRDDRMPWDAVDRHTQRVTLKTMMEARQAVMERGKPSSGLIYGPEAISVKAAADIAKVIDEQINNRLINSKFGDDSYSSAKNNYATYMRHKDLRETGQDFFTVREDAVTQKDFDSFRESLDGRRERVMFDVGWINEFAKRMEIDGVEPTIRAKFGDIDMTNTSADAARKKTAGYKQLSTVLHGDEAADEYLTLLQGKQSLAKATARIENMLRGKGVDPAPILDVIREGDDVLSFGAMRGTNGVLENASLGALARRMQALGPKEANVIRTLTTEGGPKGAAALEKIREAAAKRSNQPRGAKVSGALQQSILDSEMSPEERQVKLEDSTQNWLDNLAKGN